MKLITHFKNIILLSCLIFSNSCSKKEEPTLAPVIPTTTTTVTADKSLSLFWLDNVSKAETLWASNKINSYEVVGRMSWAWHEHSFQVTVNDGEIINSKCESNHDAVTNNNWCETKFNANDHTIPALFERARELIKRGDEMTNSQDECFYASFDFDTGVPSHVSLACPNANDEQEEWSIIFFRNIP